jgi:FKBP-type peptidyl-prolyl cis-trans isomerase SlyD
VSVQIGPDKVVTLHYTVKNDSGEVLDRSEQGEPLSYLHGAGGIVPGLESALAGKVTGDRVSVSIPAAQAYGERDPALVHKVPRRAFGGVAAIEPGMRFEAQTEQGARPVTVVRVQGDMVTIDGNHPLAGQNLNFDVEIADVREASAEELTHGHVHGPGGHHHHG